MNKIVPKKLSYKINVMHLRLFLLILVFNCFQFVKGNDFVWYSDNRPVTYCAPESLAPVVSVAIDMFREDIQQVTGRLPQSVSIDDATIRIIQLDNTDIPIKDECQLINWPRNGMPFI